jgi:hypothetical protein
MKDSLAHLQSENLISQPYDSTLVQLMDSIQVSCSHSSQMLDKLVLSNEAHSGYDFWDLKIWIPLIVFGVGLFVQFYLRQKGRKRNQEVQKEVFLTWIELMIPNLEKQAKHQNEWTLGLKEAKDFDIADFPRYAIPLDRYKEFSLELMIKTFVLNSTSKGKENATLIQEISTAIEFFTQTELWSKDSFKMFVENLQGLLMNWNSALTKLKEMELELANAFTSSGEKDQVMLYHAYFEIQRK